MSLHCLAARLARLEAQRPAETEPPYTPPEPPPGWYEEVVRILWQYGLFASVAEMCRQCFGLTDPAAVAAMAAEVARIVEETPTDAF